MATRQLLALAVATASLATACGTQPDAGRPLAVEPSAKASSATPTPILPNLLPGMPPPLQADDVYAATRQGLAAAVKDLPELIYVPNGVSNTVTVIDAKTATVVGEYPAGDVPQHVVPSYDLLTLWVNSSTSNSLTRMDPATGKVIDTIEVDDPYNLYFTPDGKDAVVIAERLRRIDFRDPETSGPPCPPPARVSTTSTSPPTAAPSSPAVSSARSCSRSTRPPERSPGRWTCPAAASRRTSSSHPTARFTSSPT